MALSVVRFDTTPNPNALKCVLDASVTEAPRSYFRAEQATEAGDTLAASLFAIPGVTNVLIHSDWITVCKASEASWAEIKRGIREVVSKADPHVA